MPTIPTPSNTAAYFPVDWTLIWIIFGVAGILILILETAFVFTAIRLANVYSKARWTRLRQRGVVIVDGPALIWTDTIPIAPKTSTFNLRQTLQESQDGVDARTGSSVPRFEDIRDFPSPRSTRDHDLQDNSARR